MQPVVIQWAGGEHAFRLGLAELETIQQKTDCGPEYLLHRINAAQWHIGDLMEVLRNGLIGAGMPHVDALKIVRKAFDNHPAILFKVPAQAVLAAFLFGPPDDQPGEDSPAGDQTQTGSNADAGSSAPITG
ncbi:gene transfer agent family protein [Paracoccus denitrificans]|uniref:gene transfer agent family protein n=1 Tax=Paracoccus denitrificans TaxID=266 RepID=UPI001E4B48D3|nr:gene transfer agent family protein [Paracoccus denitrificans]UFS66557.1 gene transfer agent family protein [Paracoccus denitrificans]